MISCIYSSSKIGLRSFRFVGDAAALIPCSTPTKALSLFGRPTMKGNQRRLTEPFGKELIRIPVFYLTITAKHKRK